MQAIWRELRRYILSPTQTIRRGQPGKSRRQLEARNGALLKRSLARAGWDPEKGGSGVSCCVLLPAPTAIEILKSISPAPDPAIPVSSECTGVINDLVPRISAMLTIKCGDTFVFVATTPRSGFGHVQSFAYTRSLAAAMRVTIQGLQYKEASPLSDL